MSPPRRRPERRRKRGLAGRLLRWGTVCAFAGALALGAGAAFSWRALERPFPDRGPARIAETLVAPGTSARAILRQLEREGILRNAMLARAYLVYLRRNPPLRAGEYRFALPLSTVQVIDRLARGEVTTYPVTVIEGLTLEEAAQAIAASGLTTADEVRAATRSPARIRDLDPAASDLEGYLLPDTYQFARGTSAAVMVDTMVSAFRRRLAEEIVPLLTPEERPRVRDLVTLASIVEKEAARDDERARIAAVYRNRLRIGMGLYADPTIIYAKKLAGDWDGNLRRADLELDSPYNTYRHPGLPPSPICSPGFASLRAAAQPEEVPYLYFVARNDGSHVFAITLAEHNRNVEIWQRQFFRDRARATQKGREAARAK